MLLMFVDDLAHVSVLAINLVYWCLICFVGLKLNSKYDMVLVYLGKLPGKKHSQYIWYIAN